MIWFAKKQFFEQIRFQKSLINNKSALFQKTDKIFCQSGLTLIKIGYWTFMIYYSFDQNGGRQSLFGQQNLKYYSFQKNVQKW